jgi:hypothetical protein
MEMLHLPASFLFHNIKIETDTRTHTQAKIVLEAAEWRQGLEMLVVMMVSWLQPRS